jgi:opacity protein-like surface antigen
VTPLWQLAGADFSFAGARQQFQAVQQVSYSPYYDFGGLQDRNTSPIGDAAASHGDFANRDLAALTSTTDVSWSRPISRRIAVSAAYNLRRTTFGRSELDMTSQSLGGRMTRRFTRYVSLRTGYTYRVADPALAQTRTPRNHELDLGLDYSRPLSISKRTTLSVASGSALTPQGDRLAFNLTGGAALTRQIGRTWEARAGVNRSVQLLEGFTEPVLINGVTATLSGAVRRRVNFSCAVGLSTSSVGLDTGSANGFASWTGGAGLSFALGRRAALEAQYFYAGYRFDGDLAVAPGLANGRQQRQGVRVGLTWREPLVGH